MRKIVLLFVFVAFSCAAYSQTVVNAFTAQLGVWVEDKWEMSIIVECDINFTLDGNLITVDDMARSSYFTYEMIADENMVVQWKAVDDQLEECVVVMEMDESKNKYIVIVYADRLYKYNYN